MRGQDGFSLIEVVISIAIVALMLGVGVPAFRDYGRLASLRQAAADIQLAILQAHNLSLAPETAKSAPQNYYGVQFVPPDEYRVIRCKEQVASVSRCEQDTDDVVAQYQLEQGISFEGSQPSYLGYLVGAGGRPTIPPIPNNIITIRSAFVQPPGGELARMRLEVNPVTGQVNVQ